MLGIIFVSRSFPIVKIIKRNLVPLSLRSTHQVSIWKNLVLKVLKILPFKYYIRVFKRVPYLLRDQAKKLLCMIFSRVQRSLSFQVVS